jgi:hypothetical protein
MSLLTKLGFILKHRKSFQELLDEKGFLLFDKITEAEFQTYLPTILEAATKTANAAKFAPLTSARMLPYAKQLAECVVGNTDSALDAAKRWNDACFTAAEDVFIDYFTESSWLAYQAYETIPIGRGSLNLVNKITEDNELSAYAVKHLDDDRYLPFAGDFIRGVSNPTIARQIIDEMSYDRLLPHANTLIGTVAREPIDAFMAGRDWGTREFELRLDLLFDSILSSARVYDACLQEWRSSRKDKLWLYNLGAKVENLPIIQEAYGRAGVHIKDFEDGLVNVKPENQRQWAQYILDHFKPKGIGGGNYREVVV